MLLSPYIDHVIPFLLITTRLTALLALAPGFTGGLIPNQVKLGLVLMVSFILHFGLGLGMDALTIDTSVLWIGMLREFTVGAGMGMMIHILFMSIGYAGSLIAPQMGLAVSQLMDPQSESMQPLLTTFLNIIAVMMFFAIDGHLMIIRALHDSYRLVPLAGFTFPDGFATALAMTGADLFIIAFKICSPVLAVLIFLNTGMAIMARAVPQMNILVVGFIITISVGILTLALSLPASEPYLRELLTSAIEKAMFLLKAV